MRHNIYRASSGSIDFVGHICLLLVCYFVPFIKRPKKLQFWLGTKTRQGSATYLGCHISYSTLGPYDPQIWCFLNYQQQIEMLFEAFGRTPMSESQSRLLGIWSKAMLPSMNSYHLFWETAHGLLLYFRRDSMLNHGPPIYSVIWEAHH